jgi:hypothetical protein
VLRPLLRGEDPGQLSDFGDAGGMAVTMFAFVGCVGWAAWRLWTRQPVLYLGPVEVLLAVMAALLFAGSWWAPYQRAAWLTAWEGVGLFLIVFLIRQLAVRPEEQRGLMAVLLAGAVALAAQGVYQAVYELPTAAKAAAKKDSVEHYIRDELAGRAITANPLDLQQRGEFPELERQLEERQVHGPYFHSTSLAGCLALMLPMLFGAVVAAGRSSSPGWLRSLAGAGLLLTAIVLVLTRCWSAVAAVGLVGLAALALAWPARRGGRKVGALVALALAGLIGYVLFASGVLRSEVEHWREVWPVSWKIIKDHPYRGVGPSQFSFYYPRYMPQTACPREMNPSSGILELWSEDGLLLPLAFAAAMFLFFRAVRKWWRADTPPAPLAASSEEVEPPGSPVRWEYYIGGMAGIVLSFVLRAGPFAADVWNEAITAGLRSVVWFAAVAVFESIDWSPRQRVAALTSGVAALLLVLLVNPGISYPSVVGALWIAVALTLVIVSPRPLFWLSRHQVAFVLPLPALIAVAFGYFAFVFYPACASDSVIAKTNQAGAYYAEQQNREIQKRDLRNPVEFVRGAIIGPLLRAEREDPGNVRLRVLLAYWYKVLAEQAPRDNTRSPSDTQRALGWARLAQLANKEGPEGYLQEYEINRTLAGIFDVSAMKIDKDLKGPKAKKMPAPQREKNMRTSFQLRAKARLHYHDAAKALRAYLKRDPTNPVLHYFLAEALNGTNELKDRGREAQKALNLDDDARPPRNLSGAQREQAEKWAPADSSR